MQKESPNPCHGATLSTCTIHIYYQFISIHSFDARIAWICFDTGAVEQGVRDLHPGTWDLGNSHHHHRLLWSCPPRPVASVLSCSSWRYRKSCRVFRPMSKLFDVSVLSFRVFCDFVLIRNILTSAQALKVPSEGWTWPLYGILHLPQIAASLNCVILRMGQLEQAQVDSCLF